MNRGYPKKLFIFTDEFPWGRGEKAFVAPELEYLSKEFNVVVVSLSPDEYLELYDLISEVPKGIEVVHYARSPLIKRIMLGIRFMFTKVGCKEISFLRKEGFSIGRLLSAINALGNAVDLRAFCIRQDLFLDVNNSVYYSFWFNTQCLALAIEKAMGNPIKIAARLHGYDLYKERRRFCYQPFQEFKRDMCDRIFFACEYAEEYFRKEFGKELFEGQYQLNYLGVRANEDVLCKSQGNDGKFRIVSCSSIDSNKRVDIIADALSYLNDEKYCWTHFGDGELKESVKKKLQGKKIKVSFKGNVSNSEIIKYYSSNFVDLFITTTATEGGCPVSVQEALSFGIPIVGTKVGGVPEAIDGNGILLTANPSTIEVADAIEKIASSDSELIVEMRRRSLRIWKSKFDIEANKNELIMQLRKLVN